MAMDNVWIAIQDRQQRREAIEKNSGGYATFYMDYETVGTGELNPDQPIRFDIPFVYEPAVTSGCRFWSLPSDTYTLPHVTAGVQRWERNDRGFFVGAYLLFNITSELRNPDLTSAEIEALDPHLPRILHHFVFSGGAHMELSEQVRNEAMNPRMTPLRPPAS